jgi:hypothetical protein
MAAGGLRECRGGGTVDAMSDTCGSCGIEGEELVAVHRVYVTPEAWDTEGKVEVLDEVEHWCFPCRTSYPHQELDEGTEVP